MKKNTVTYYCDDCRKVIVVIEDTPEAAYELLEHGVFQPRFGWKRDKQDTRDLCRNCMMVLLDKWKEEVLGHQGTDAAMQ